MHVRKEAYEMIIVLRNASLLDTPAYRMLAKEYDRDLYTGESRLHLAIKKAKPLVDALRQAGRSRPKRAQAKAILLTTKMRVR